MSYESEFFEIMKNAYVNKSWTDELYHEQKRTFPKMTAYFTFEAENGEKYSVSIVVDHEKHDVFARVLTEAVGNDR
jgi:hypothetical protein